MVEVNKRLIALLYFNSYVSKNILNKSKDSKKMFSINMSERLIP